MKPSYPTPADLLQRCMETIPPKAVVQPRPLLESRSRTRLLLLAAAATVPIAAVLVVIPVKHYLSLRQQENIQEDAGGTIPYLRIEMYRAANLTRNGGTAQYTLSIKDARGNYWGAMKSNFRDEDDNHVSNYLFVPGTSYYRKRNKVLVRSIASVKPTLDKKPDDSIKIWGGKLVSEKTVLWEGQNLLKREYVYPATPFQKKNGYHAIRREVFSSPDTHTLREMREWVYFTSDDPTQSKGAILAREAHFYYTPRPEDAQFFDPKCFMQGATLIKRFTEQKAKSKP